MRVGNSLENRYSSYRVGEDICVKCGSQKYCVKHHVTYVPEFIIPLCRSCHMKIHAYPKEHPNFIKHTMQERDHFYFLKEQAERELMYKRLKI